MRRLKAVNRKNCLLYLGVFGFLGILAYSMLTNIFFTPTVPDFELQVKDCYYNPSIGSFRVSGTFGIQVPDGYSFRLSFISITDGNKTIILNPESEGHGGAISILFRPSFWSHGVRAGPDWTFLLTQRITLESKNVQLTFEYEIRYHDHVLETGVEVFSVNVA